MVDLCENRLCSAQNIYRSFQQSYFSKGLHTHALIALIKVSIAPVHEDFGPTVRHVSMSCSAARVFEAPASEENLLKIVATFQAKELSTLSCLWKEVFYKNLYN